MECLLSPPGRGILILSSSSSCTSASCSRVLAHRGWQHRRRILGQNGTGCTGGWIRAAGPQEAFPSIASSAAYRPADARCPLSYANRAPSCALIPHAGNARSTVAAAHRSSLGANDLVRSGPGRQHLRELLDQRRRGTASGAGRVKTPHRNDRIVAVDAITLSLIQAFGRTGAFR